MQANSINDRDAIISQSLVVRLLRRQVLFHFELPGESFHFVPMKAMKGIARKMEQLSQPMTPNFPFVAYARALSLGRGES